MKANGMVPIVSKNIPKIAKRLAPKRSKARPVIGLITPIIRAPANSDSPDSKAEKP